MSAPWRAGGERPQSLGQYSSSQYPPRHELHWSSGSAPESQRSRSPGTLRAGCLGVEPLGAERLRSTGVDASVRLRARTSEQSRDPNTGHLHGYEYSGRFEPRYGQFDDHAPDRSGSNWRRRAGATRAAIRGARWASPAQTSAGRALAAWAATTVKGPKGYVRSDDRIREDVCDRLSDDDIVDASDISVQVKDGEVTLEGSVTDRHMKHRAEDIIEEVSGVRDVNNKLRTKKSFMQELGDKFTGDDENEHRGHSGSGTRNSPPPPRR